MKRYIGIRCCDGRPSVRVVFDGRHYRVRSLWPDNSLKLAQHSPDGFEWGSGGSGPAQLALAILLDFTASRQIALHFYQEFKARFIAQLPRQHWEIRSAQIRDFLAAELAKFRLVDSDGFASKSGVKTVPSSVSGAERANIFPPFGSNR